MKNHGIETPLIAIGSLCVRKKILDTKRVIHLAQRNFPNARLHGFGIDLRFLKDDYIASALWSADTQAWQFGNPSRYFPRSEAEALENYFTYSNAVDRILSRHNANTRIEQWEGSN